MVISHWQSVGRVLLIPALASIVFGPIQVRAQAFPEGGVLRNVKTPGAKVCNDVYFFKSALKQIDINYVG